MIINNKVLCLPPYLSTSWKMVSSIQVIKEGDSPILKIILTDGHSAQIPNVPREVIDHIFACHATHLEEADGNLSQLSSKEGNFLDIPLQFGTNGFQGFGPLQHNPEQANAPDMPPELLNKISQVTEAFSGALGIEAAPVILPEAQPNCNCVHCQIVRAMKGQAKEEPLELEEAVSEEDLKFKEFDVEEKGEKLYQVTNPLDQTESFQVFLGSPIGCTCGKQNCDHIKAVLNS